MQCQSYREPTTSRNITEEEAERESRVLTDTVYARHGEDATPRECQQYDCLNQTWMMNEHPCQMCQCRWGHPHKVPATHEELDAVHGCQDGETTQSQVVSHKLLHVGAVQTTAGVVIDEKAIWEGEGKALEELEEEQRKMEFM